MKQKARRHDRLTIVAEGLLAGVLFLLLTPATVQAQHADTPGDGTAGSVWRLARVGGGLTSPSGRTGMGLQGVAANGELFVAVGWDGTIAHSIDGNRWVEASFSATDRWLSDVAWGGGRFVAVGNGRAVYSSDGDRWRRSRSYDLGDLNSVAWGHDRFVAVGDDGSTAFSNDGIRWRRVRNVATRRVHDATIPDLRAVAWGGDRFVAVGNDGTIVRSADGESWLRASVTGTSATLTGVAWNSERFVAVGWNDSGPRVTILHSNDGDRWDAARSTSFQYSEALNDVAWGGERFVAVGSHTILHSSDGDYWEMATGHGGRTLRGCHVEQRGLRRR